MTTAQITTFDIAALTLAEENARHGVTYDHDGLLQLAGSMRAMHQLTGRALIEPLKGYATDTGAAIWDGGRRRAALGLLADIEGDDEAQVIVSAVPVILTTREEAQLASAATFVREDMHPTERFLMWNALFDLGQTPEQIAAAVGASAKTVAQLLRFRMLAPEVFAAFQGGAMDFDTALAFTLTDDHEQQRQVLASFGDKQPSRYHVRERLTQGAIRADDRRARLVGRDEYEKAGGRFLTDLFSNREVDETWQDAALLQKLYDAKLAAMIEDLTAEGWGDVRVINDSYGWANGYSRIEPAGAGKKGKKAFTAEQMTAGVAFIVFDYTGTAKIERGWSKEAKRTTPATVPLAKQNPARYGFGHKGHHVMTQVATEATRVALMRKPDVGVDALATQLAWAVLRKPQYGGVADQLASRFVPESRNGRPPAVTVEGQVEFTAAIERWSARLPQAQIAFYDAVRALKAKEKQELMALCFAATLSADEEKFDGWVVKPRRWKHLGWMAREAEVDFVQAWEPGAEFWNGGSKDALMAADKAMNGDDQCTRGGKKSEMAAFIGHHAVEKGWRPELLATLTNVADPVETAVDDDHGGPADAATVEEYLNWIAWALVNYHDVEPSLAAAQARQAHEAELARANAEFGDPDYGWSRADAASAATDYVNDGIDA